MSTFDTHSSLTPCPGCGEAVAEGDGHVCDPERALDHRLFELRTEIADFDDQLASYLESPRGRFEQWYAARVRPAF